MNITLTTGELEHLQSYTLAFDRSAGLSLQVGNLRVQIVVAPSTEEKPAVAREAIKETLTVIYRVTGKLPCVPHSYGLIRPEHIGTTDGVPIHVWWRLSQSVSTSDVLFLDCAVFRKQTAATATSAENNHGN